MNLRDLQYLVAIDEVKHFGKAAERCFVSQPTLSGQLKKLEEHLGVQLVERHHRKVFLTDVGKEVALIARRVLDETRSIEELARTFTKPMSGRIRVGIIPTVAPYLLPLIVGPIKERWPDLSLQLQEEQTALLVNMLRDGDVDTLILALGVPGTEGFEEEELYDEPFHLAVPRDHPLAERDEIIEEDLSEQTLLLLQDGHCLRGQALEVCYSAGAREDMSFRATSLETLRHMVASGAGVTLMPRLAVPGPVSPDGLIRYLPFASPGPMRKIGMLYRTNAGRRSSFLKLAEEIRAAPADLLVNG
ncbi:MAG: DNA-binding transcriptional regulator OxyR [Acidobacteriota bacterium]|nr:DNA-binding transcriptional regulator OxyR [Acidobacteriota bacterium]